MPATIERNPDPAAPAGDYYMTTEQLARYIGYSPHSIRTMAHRGRLPFKKKIGRGLRFLKSDVDKWIEEQNSS